MTFQNSSFAGLKKVTISRSDQSLLDKIIKRSHVFLKNGTWVSSSGLKLHTWIATERILTQPHVLNLIAKNLKKIIVGEKIQAIVACSIVGIPLATTISNTYKLPLIIMRKKRELHGEKTSIIGNVDTVKSKNILLVDDSILSGNTIRHFYNRLKRSKYNVTAVFVFDVWFNQGIKNEVDHWAKKETITIWYIKDYDLKLNNK